MNGSPKTKIALFFAAIFVVLFVLVALQEGIGGPKLPEGDILFVEDVPGGGGVTLQEYEKTFTQSWKRAGLPQAPERGSEQYTSVQDAAISDLLDGLWLQGEADSLGIQVTGREVQNELAAIKETQFPNKKAFEDFLRESGFTEPEVLERVRLQVLSRKIEEKIRASTPEPSEKEIENFYEASLDQYTTPKESRFLIISTSDQKEALQIEKSLERDSSSENFEKLARKYSDDPSSTQGGKASSLNSSYPAPVQEAILQAEEDVVEGPVRAEVQGKAKTYFFRMEEVVPEKVEPLDVVRKEISEQIQQNLEQTTLENFIEDYQSLWTSRTVCAEGFVTSRCSNYQSAPTAAGANPACYDKEAFEKAKEPIDCPAPVVSRSVQNPGSVETDPLGNPLQAPLPQGPALPPDVAEETAPPTGTPIPTP